MNKILTYVIAIPNKTKWIINKFFIGISVFFISYMFYFLPSTKFMQWFFAIISGSTDIGNWYVFSLALGYWDIGKRNTAKILFTIVGIYLLLFGAMSSVGFFLVEINKKQDIITKVENVEKYNQKIIEQNNNRIDILMRDLDLETEKGGYGDRSKSIESNINTLKVENNNLLVQSTETNKPQDKEVYRELSKAFIFISADALKIIMFSAMMGMLYLFNILTTSPAKIKGEIVKQEDEIKEKVTVTREDLIIYINENKERIFKYIDAMFRSESVNRDGKWILNSNLIIQQSTDLTEDECITIKNTLLQIKKGKVPLIKMEPGKSEANFSKDVIVKAIKYFCK